jgi:hypothetical protein
MRKIFTKGNFIWNEKEQRYVHDDFNCEYELYDGAITECKGAGGGGSTTTIQKSDPWGGQQPFLSAGYESARDRILNAPAPTYYPGNTVVPFSPETTTALDLQTARALMGSPISRAANEALPGVIQGQNIEQILGLYSSPDLPQMSANQNLQSTLNGDYLYGGEGFDQALDAASRKILPMVDSAFERAGRSGSGLAQQAKTQALADAFAGQYGQERQNQLTAAGLANQSVNGLLNAVQNERQNQLRAALVAPQFAQQDYQDISKLAEVGAQRESFEAEKIADAIARHNFEYESQIMPIQQYMNIISGGGIATSSMGETSPSNRFGLGNILGGVGGGLLGYGLGPALNMNPLLSGAAGLLTGLI